MATFTSTQSGNWSSASTWGGAGVPGNGDDVVVSQGHIVTFNYDYSSIGRISTLKVYGTLRFSTTQITNLRISSSIDLYGGEVQIGHPTPMPAFITVGGVRRRPVATVDTASSTVFNRVSGTPRVRLAASSVGAVKDTLAVNTAAGSTSITVSGKVTFAQGDLIVLARTTTTGTDCHLVNIRTVTGVSGNTLTLNSALTYSCTSGDAVILLGRPISVLVAYTFFLPSLFVCIDELVQDPLSGVLLYCPTYPPSLGLVSAGTTSLNIQINEFALVNDSSTAAFANTVNASYMTAQLLARNTVFTNIEPALCNQIANFDSCYFVGGNTGGFGTFYSSAGLVANSELFNKQLGFCVRSNGVAVISCTAASVNSSALCTDSRYIVAEGCSFSTISSPVIASKSSNLLLNTCESKGGNGIDFDRCMNILCRGTNRNPASTATYNLRYIWPGLASEVVISGGKECEFTDDQRLTSSLAMIGGSGRIYAHRSGGEWVARDIPVAVPPFSRLKATAFFYQTQQMVTTPLFQIMDAAADSRAGFALEEVAGTAASVGAWERLDLSWANSGPVPRRVIIRTVNKQDGQTLYEAVQYTLEPVLRPEPVDIETPMRASQYNLLRSTLLSQLGHRHTGANDGRLLIGSSFATGSLSRRNMAGKWKSIAIPANAGAYGATYDVQAPLGQRGTGAVVLLTNRWNSVASGAFIWPLDLDRLHPTISLRIWIIGSGSPDWGILYSAEIWQWTGTSWQAVVDLDPVPRVFSTGSNTWATPRHTFYAWDVSKGTFKNPPILGALGLIILRREQSTQDTCIYDLAVAGFNLSYWSWEV